MNALTHTDLLLILGILLIPAVWQFVTTLRIHGLWLAVALAGGVFTVVQW